jgi:hypothetical protein
MSSPTYVALVSALFALRVGPASATPYTTFFGTPDTHYTTTVQLKDGTRAVCAVNEPSSMLPANAGVLDPSDRIEAEIDATDRLRSHRHIGNKSDYPSDRWASKVQCVRARNS